MMMKNTPPSAALEAVTAAPQPSRPASAKVVLIAAANHRRLRTAKLAMTAAIKLLNTFEIVPLNEDDQKWAEQQLIRFRLSHGVEINDCLIASICHRLQIPIYTQNVKDMRKLLPAPLVIKPFTA